MSETQDTTTQIDTGDDFQPITLASQAEVDSFIGGRVKKVQARYADYQELKAKAAELDKVKQAQMTEADRIKALENELAAERQNSLIKEMRRDVAAEKGVPANRIHGNTREELEASADELLAFIAEKINHQQQSKPKPATGLKSGATGTDSRMDPKERAAQALRTLRSGT